MPRWIIVITVIFTIAASAVVATTLTDTLFTTTHMTPEPRSPAAPAAPPPALPAPTPSTTPSASNTETDKKLDTALARIAELEAKLKVGPGTKPELETKSSSLSDWVPSWWWTKLSPPSVGSVPKVATPLPTVPPPPGAGPKTKLDEAIAEIEKKVRAKPADTESKSVPTVPPPPAASTPDLKSWVKGVLPTIPPPPSATTASLKGPSGSWGGFFSGFSGSCSVRGEEVELKVGETLKLTEGGSKECRVIYDASTESIIVARDGKGEFFLKSGVGRNPREVKLTAGKGYFKYSLCPANTGNVMLDWDCSPLN